MRMNPQTWRWTSWGLPVSDPKAVADLIAMECDALKTLLLEKNKAYGNSALDPIRVFSKADPIEQIRVRLDDKLSRLARGSAAGEDVEQDLLGYLILSASCAQDERRVRMTKSKKAPEAIEEEESFDRDILGRLDAVYMEALQRVKDAQRSGKTECEFCDRLQPFEKLYVGHEENGDDAGVYCIDVEDCCASNCNRRSPRQ